MCMFWSELFDQRNENEFNIANLRRAMCLFWSELGAFDKDS